MSEVIKAARVFANGNHERITANRLPKQQTCESHLKAVAEIVSSVTESEEMIAAAWLHDIVEDTEVTLEEIDRRFGAEVAKLVREVTPVSRVSDGDRPSRFALDKKHFAKASPDGKTIKAADLIDTCRDLYKSNDPCFSTMALEAGELAGVLVGGDAGLLDRLRRDLDKYRIAFRVPGTFSRSPEVSPLSLSLTSLKVFERAFRAQDIAEPLLSFDCEHDSSSARTHMEKQQVKIAGVRIGGMIAGYVCADELHVGRCGDHTRQIDPAQVIEGTDSLTDVIEILTQNDWCFVDVLGTVAGVICRADVQKPPVRMWLFGIITVAEQEFTERVRLRWPDDSWETLLSPARVEKAKQLLAERKRRGERCGLVDCLQLADKLDIMISQPDMLQMLGFFTAGAAKRAGKEIESLRNSLAHSQDFVEQDWPQVVRLARRVEQMVQSL